MTEQSETPLTAGTLVWQQLFPVQPTPKAMALGLLRHWAAEKHAPQLILEARADVTGVEYLIGSQLRHAQAVRRAIEQLMVGAIVTSADPSDRQDATTTRRLRLTTTARPLEPFDAVATERSVLHALTAVQKGESLTLQVVLGPRRYPRLGPREPKRTDQKVVSDRKSVV